MTEQPIEFEGIALVAKANVYFDGKVVSHSFRLTDGTRKTAGLIFPGTFHFGTEQAERMHVMRQQVREQNVYRWAGRMLADAGRWRLRARIEARVRRHKDL